MTGYKSKKAAAQDKLDDDDSLTIAYQSGYYDGKKAAQPAQEPDTYRSVPHGHCTHPRCKEVFSAYIEVNKRLAHYEPEGKSPMILNAAPPQRKPLTIKDIKIIATYCDEHVTDEDVIEITRRVEAAHDIKENT